MIDLFYEGFLLIALCLSWGVAGCLIFYAAMRLTFTAYFFTRKQFQLRSK